MSRVMAGEEMADRRRHVEVRRSARRRRTVSAYRDGERSIVLVPAGLPKREEERLVAKMLERLEAKERRRAGPSDTALLRRARDLSRRHLDGAARPVTVRWAGNQQRRWGSCTPTDGSIRISFRLQPLPPWVLDYVRAAGLAHLVEGNRGRRFWELVGRSPLAERARGLLEGFARAAHAGAEPGPAPAVDGPDDAEPWLDEGGSCPGPWSCWPSERRAR